MTAALQKENPKIHVNGLDFEWDNERGVFLIAGQPAVCMWIESTMAGFMSGLHKMVGTERFHLAVYGAGEDGIQGEWEHFIAPAPSYEEGLALVGAAANNVGLGLWECVSLDREKKEAHFRAKNSWEALYQRALGVCWGTSSLAGRFAGYCKHIFQTHCWAEQTKFIAKGDEWDEFIVRPSTKTVQDHLEALITSDKATRADLDATLERLKAEVHERKQAEDRLKQEILDRKHAEQVLLEKLEIIRRQEDSIRAMSNPILQLWDGVLALPVIGLVDSTRANQMMESLLEAIIRTKARFTILDLTGVDIIDTGAADHLLKVVRAAQLLGTRCVVSGIAPNIAQTIIGLQLNLSELLSFSTLEMALRYALRAAEHPVVMRNQGGGL
ncbi:RsbR, positive regulator of sigma-B [Labilithrix luteola]|uniref:RsbR, positive regulator of sigma-B n=1 Tax=Labilithrix luteola TaxID=1391654 RepID=A0A0K1QA70_9BACT|nr:STAS domain-containing protein [Labilithrix luteola]AKV02300.1 RsbR, positive regulator of sigma-B [Labilithrix luteola]